MTGSHAGAGGFRRLTTWCLAVCVAGLSGACASRTLRVPAGPGTPLADAASVHAGIARACAGVRTLTAELALSGRAEDQKVRGRALAGFAAPGAMRLEGLAPFGAPAFILVARGGEATLLLPRDERVLRGAAAEDILGALTGVALAPADLQAILTGCVAPAATPVRGAQHGDDWRTIELKGGATLYLRRAGSAWQLRAADRDGWRVEYSGWQGAFPRVVRLTSQASGRNGRAAPAVDLTAQISQLETNAPIDAAAFSVDVPRGSLPITLDELRQAGPLRGSESR